VLETKYLLPLLAALGLATLAHASAPSPAVAPRRLKVVTTLRDLGDITREIGGERVEVKSITKGRENIHRVLLKPSHLIAVSRADVFVQVGLSLEHTFVPGLLLNARNEKLRPGAPGLITVSDGWESLLQVGTNQSRRTTADNHPQGNPHVNLSPRAGRHFADRILAGLAAVEPASEAYFEQRHADYVRRLDEAAARWAEVGSRLRDRKIVIYHQDFTYFVDAYGLRIVDTIEPKPGLPPTPGHIAQLVKRMRDEDVTVILTAAWSNNRSTAEVARNTGARIVELPTMVGGVPGADTWIEMMDVLHARLAEAFPESNEAAGSDG